LARGYYRLRALYRADTPARACGILDDTAFCATTRRWLRNALNDRCGVVDHPT
jgi:hypothetical protein